MKNLYLFSSLSEEDLDIIIEKYVDLQFVSADKIIIRPKKNSYSLYIIAFGMVIKLPNTH